MRNILITGNNGFIGRAVEGELVRKHSDIYRFGGFDVGTNLESWSAQWNDLCSSTMMEPDTPDTIIHIGAIPNSQLEGNRLWDMNYTTTLVLGEYAYKYCCNFIYMSSWSAINPTNQYGRAKRAAEDWLRMRFASKDMLTDPKLTILRPMNVWSGWEERPTRTVHSIVYKLLTNKLIAIYEGCVRDFIHVDDVAKAVVQVVNSYYEPGRGKWLVDSDSPLLGTYEIGTGMGIDIKTLADKMQNYHHEMRMPPVIGLPSSVVEKAVMRFERRLPDFNPSPIGELLKDEVLKYLARSKSNAGDSANQ